jgi:hypothetical protein
MDEGSGMEQIFNALIEFFEDDEWDFQWVEGMSVLSMGFAGRNGKWMCYAQARERQQQFVFYSVMPVNAPPEQRQTMAEFITRANYGMIVGNFELDFDDGEIRYKTSIDVEGATLFPPLIRQVVYANVFIMDRYLPGLMSVLYGGKNAAEAIAAIETEDDLEQLQDDEVEVDFDEEEDLEDYPLIEYSAEEDDDELDDDDFYDDDDSPTLNGNGKH